MIVNKYIALFLQFRNKDFSNELHLIPTIVSEPNILLWLCRQGQNAGSRAHHQMLEGKILRVQQCSGGSESEHKTYEQKPLLCFSLLIRKICTHYHGRSILGQMIHQVCSFVWKLRNLVHKTSISQIVDREKLIVEFERFESGEKQNNNNLQAAALKLSKNFRVGFRFQVFEGVCVVLA